MKCRNKKIKYLVLTITSIVFFLFITETAALADNVVGFNYKVEYPKNQLGGEKGYFDLLMPQGDKQTVKLILTNPGDKAIRINVSVNGTKTNSNGIIEYGQTLLENDASLKFPFEDVVSAPEVVELKEGEVTALEVEIKMPETSFEGMILGGIQLKKIEEESSEKTQGATVKNEYAYVIAMVLRNNDKELKPEITINNAFASQENYRNTIGINMSNTTASLLSGKMSIEAQIMKNGSQEVLFERKQSGMSIAPNSQMNFPISMGGERMVEGDYIANVLVMIENQKWEEKLEFKITKEEADKYNKRDVGLVQDRGIDWKIVVLIVASVLICVILIFVGIKFVQKQHVEKNKKKLKNKSKNKSRDKR